MVAAGDQQSTCHLKIISLNYFICSSEIFSIYAFNGKFGVFERVNPTEAPHDNTPYSLVGGLSGKRQWSGCFI
jgi:hypothetical protein